ncbi:MAG: RNA polymerase factor sigma-54 [Armatimonadota bacterium]|nr:RNA polymerase factor sigma-54 [bacterium]
MQGQALAQKQQLRTIPVQIQANAILNMSLLELQQFIETEAMENPALSLDDSSRCPVCGFMSSSPVCPVCSASLAKSKELEQVKLSERDYLDKAFAAAGHDELFDPFRTVARTATLNDYLKQQARMIFGGRKLRIAEYLIDSLDDDGYFRESLFETAEEFAAAVPEIEDVLEIIQSFDPPGIAARDLRESLLIQLRAIGSIEPRACNAEQILMDYWEDFARMKFKTIAKNMSITPAVVIEACEFIKDNLTPRPASAYRTEFDELSPRHEAAVVPDVIVHRVGDSLTAEVVDCHGSFAKIDETYEETYKSMKSGGDYFSEDDRMHIKEHVERVRCILDAISLRKKTLARVATHMVEYQREFLLYGPSHLKPLKQKDVAKALGVHESTICRAVADKYCRLPSGEVISFEVFFDAALPVRTMISQIIARSTEPISDGEITKRLTEQGITIARRTVAKYREQLKVLPYQLRAA